MGCGCHGFGWCQHPWMARRRNAPQARSWCEPPSPIARSARSVLDTRASRLAASSASPQLSRAAGRVERIRAIGEQFVCVADPIAIGVPGDGTGAKLIHFFTVEEAITVGVVVEWVG